MAAISSLLYSNLLHQPTNSCIIQAQAPKPSLYLPKPAPLRKFHGLSHTPHLLTSREVRKRVSVVAEETSVSTQDPTSEAARRLYVGNIPRDVDNSELARVFGEHGAVERAEVMYDKYSKRSRRFGFVTMKTVEDANAAIEKLDGTEIGGRKIKVNITVNPLSTGELSLQQIEESTFVDSPYKVYVGNLAKTVTSDTLSKFFSEKGKVLSAKISRVPGTSKSSGYGFVSFSSEEDVEAAITSFNNAVIDGSNPESGTIYQNTLIKILEEYHRFFVLFLKLFEGQKIRVNKA